MLAIKLDNTTNGMVSNLKNIINLGSYVEVIFTFFDKAAVWPRRQFDLDKMGFLNYSILRMKLKTLITLIVFIMTLCAPFQITSHPDHGKTASLFTLDICHASGSACSLCKWISSCITEYPYTLALFESNCVYSTATPFFKPFLIAFQKERPPKA